MAFRERTGRPLNRGVEGPKGRMFAVRDSATGSAYWPLTDVDDAGRFREEAFGNGVVTQRSYYADKQRLRRSPTLARCATTIRCTRTPSRALGRVTTFAYDALGRTTSRLDEHGTVRRTTAWP
ncbi:hypothetical protein [Sorangium sp. So ce131]|uniref:hypothetical protein n=1 Tax=Sorangium sp. So ce131 TaxID=3133282 RepID=UPI003F62EFA1